MVVFEKPGRENSAETLRIALETARSRGIRHIVVPTNTGESAMFFQDCGDLNVVCVTHANGFRKPGELEMPMQRVRELESHGIKVLTTSHVLSGAERALSSKFGGVGPVEMIAHTLRMFGQGMKVCVEIAVMALDAGLIPFMEPVVALGGTGVGVDTAVILKASHASSILDTRVCEVLCKPGF